MFVESTDMSDSVFSILCSVIVYSYIDACCDIFIRKAKHEVEVCNVVEPENVWKRNLLF